MTTAYPGALDAFTNPTTADALNSGTVPHDQQHANANDAIEAIEAELGTNPKGSAASVKARLDAINPASGQVQGTSRGFFGASALAQTAVATNLMVVAKDSGSTFVQVAAINANSAGSADFAAYSDNGTDAAGWVDMGFTGSAFSDPAYTLTGPNEGYVLAQGVSGTGTGNLALATGSNGSAKDIVFATGGFAAANEKMRLVNSTSTLKLNGTNPAINLKGVSATPTPPASGTMNLFSGQPAGRPMPQWTTADGFSALAQPFLASCKAMIYNPPSTNANAPGVFGFASMTNVGTLTARGAATTNFLTRLRRQAVVSAAAAGSLASMRQGAAMFTLGDSNGWGGFFAAVRFGISDAATVAGARMFIGLSSSTVAATNVEPATLVNSIGIGHGAADTNLKLYYGGSAAQTPIDLGVNFPNTSVGTTAFELMLYCSPTATNTVQYQVTNLGTGQVASGTLTGTAGTVLPLNTTLLGWQLWRTNNATALAVAFDVVNIYTETPY